MSSLITLESQFSVEDLCNQHKYERAVIMYVERWFNDSRGDLKSKGDGVTFDMLDRLFYPYFTIMGNEQIDLPRTENIIVWAGCSKEYKEIILAAIGTFEIHGEACLPTKYALTPRLKHIPLAQPSDFKQRPRVTKWQPLWLLPGSGTTQKPIDDTRMN